MGAVGGVEGRGGAVVEETETERGVVAESEKGGKDGDGRSLRSAWGRGRGAPA